VKILIVSDAWHPQINGVVRTLEMTLKELERLGHETRIVGPDEKNPLTFAVPFYPEIKLEFFAHRRLGRILREFQPDFIHISTEGPLGWAARRVLSLPQPDLLDSLPHAVSRISGSARASCFRRLVACRSICGLAPLSCPG
jgi:Glycosyltransferase Family 4